MFGIISDFLVQELFSISDHCPIQVSIKVHIQLTPTLEEIISSKKLIWQPDKSGIFRDLRQESLSSLQENVENILQKNSLLDKEIESFANTLYLTAFEVFGVAKRKQCVKSKPLRKYKIRGIMISVSKLGQSSRGRVRHT